MEFHRFISIITFTAFSLFLGSVVPLVTSQGTYKAVLYEQYDSRGMSIEVTNYVSDLSTLGFNDRAHSACVMGLWILYDESNYDEGAIHYALTSSIVTPYCFNLPNPTAGSISSIRYAGSPVGLSVETFNLYEHYNFGGTEEYVLNYRPSLNLAGRHKSIIITGASNWTVYEQTNYSGPQICLVSSGTRAIIFDVNDVGISPGSLRSVMKGCDRNPEVIVTLPNSPVSGSYDAFRLSRDQ